MILIISFFYLLQRKVDSIGANPFTGETSAAAPISVSQPPAVSDVREDVDDVATPEDDGIISRCHMNEEQRRIKERFQEKQREEARKSAQQDKLAQKRVSLKQIVVNMTQTNHSMSEI